jgi:hypothetical protein
MRDRVGCRDMYPCRPRGVDQLALYPAEPSDRHKPLPSHDEPVQHARVAAGGTVGAPCADVPRAGNAHFAHGHQDLTALTA